MTGRLLLVFALTLAWAAPAQAISIGPDGTTAEEFSYDTAIRQRVFIPQPGIDQDLDGTADRIAVEIIRPNTTDPTPTIIDPSPYFTTLCRGNESQCIGDTDGDGLNDRWPLFVGKYFVPRGYAYVLAESNGTGNSSGCPLHGGPGDIAGLKSVIDWLNGRVQGVDKNGTPVVASWHNGKSAMIGKSYDGTLTNGVAATGVAGLETIIPESAISSWYDYSRMNGVRLNTGTHYPAYLSNLVTNTDRQALCAPTRTTMNTDDGDATGDFNAFWDARNYLTDAGHITASAFVVHGLQDDNVKTNNFANWWAELAANKVPRKLWLIREGHVDPFDSRRAAWVDTLHRWLDYWLLDIQNGIMDERRVDIEDAKDVFHTYADWPLPGTEAVDLYPRGMGAAAASGIGLSPGGAADLLPFTDLFSQSETTMMNNPTGSQANRRVWLSGVLTDPLRLSGVPRVTVQASLDKPQSNLAALLVDYGTGTQIQRGGEGIQNTNPPVRTCWGQSPTAPTSDFSACYVEVTKPTTSVTQWRVSRGILDSSNRNSLVTPEPVVTGTQTTFTFPLLPNDYTFPAGHQIGIVLVGNLSSLGVNATTSTAFSVDPLQTKVTLPVVGGYRAAVATGAFAPDTVAPGIAVSPDVEVHTTDPAGTVVHYAAPTATDNEDPVPAVSCAPPSGTVFAVGETDVACEAVDATGNRTPAGFKVTVILDAVLTPTATATASVTPTATATATATVTGTPTAMPSPTAPPPDPNATVTPPPAPPSGGETEPDPTPPPGLDTQGDVIAPALDGLRVVHGRHGKVTATFDLSEDADVTVVVRRKGKKNVLKRITRPLAAGGRSVKVRGLKPGRYVLRITATDAAGNAGHASGRVRLRPPRR